GPEKVFPTILTMADPCSFASPDCCRTRHLYLRCRADFGAQALRGTAAFTARAEREALRCLVLDSRDVQVFKVTVNGQDAKFVFGEKHSYKGTPLEITFPFELRRGQEAVIEISFESSPKSSALQWFTPEQTSGKKHPFLFSQCQVEGRIGGEIPHSWVTFQISVPKELVALMSANRDGEMPDPEDSSRKIYHFSQNVPIPCYLIALVVGALESRKIGPRTLVWAEKELVDKSAYEFAEAEDMLKTAEDLVGPYVWGQYDLLVLPPSFPYGGMENPCLTFVTPTLLAGDRSLSSVIAHEISHSWTGNLVTNKTWEHFWLNEGHTVYLERRIGGRLFGEQFRHFHALGGWRELQNTINTYGDKNPITNLVPDLSDVDPDVAYSSVPYEKGFALLFYLEQLLGGQDIFIGFLKAYVQQFAYKSIVTEDWKKFLYSYFKDKVDILDKVDWNSWFHAPGMPPAKESDLCSFSSGDLKEMSSHQLVEFLALLLLEPPLPVSHVKRMQEVYDFNAIHNSEIRFRWLRLCIKSRWEEAIPLALKMATDQGRMKFTRPLFRDLYNFDKCRDLAVKTFLEHRASMHPVTSMLVGKDLKQDQ
uniref:Leukotriene A4 hydrolase n=1 Tax=Calidris pygmaea TaxID=425635 RepID=A0A8C3JNP1_9CHAR